jgi:hypothetical protein
MAIDVDELIAEIDSDLGSAVSAGMSDVAHECDIAAFHAGRSAWRRGRYERPRPIDTFLAIEAKAYDATNVSLGIARGVLGLRTDLEQWRTLLVAAAAIDASAEQLVDGWSLGAFPNVMPGSAEADGLVARFEAVMQF